jgi:hypothetical protein
MNVPVLFSPNEPEYPTIALSGAEGELLSISVALNARDLERLLDRLGQSRYPIDPQIKHDAQIDGHIATLVEFPAYAGWLNEIQQLLEGFGAVTIRKCFAHATAN